MKLSIVIPASGIQTENDDTLISVLENRPGDCDILFVHAPTYVDPYDLGDEVRFLQCEATDRLSQLNAGFAAATGQIVHTISPGMVVTPDWTDAARDEFEDDDDLGALAPAVFTVGSKQPMRGVGYSVSRGRELIRRPRQRILAPAIACGFYRRSAVQQMQGFDTEFAEFADVELGLRMYADDYRVVARSEVCLESTASLEPVSTMRGYRAGQLRGRLFRKAKACGLASSAGLSLLTEPLRNGIGLGAITGTVGRLFCGHEESADHERPADGDSDLSATRRAA